MLLQPYPVCFVLSAVITSMTVVVLCNQWARIYHRKQLIVNDKIRSSEIIHVLQITHCGIFDAGTVADYELKI